MRTSFALPAAAMVSLMVVLAASVSTPQAQEASGRYTMSPTDGGFVRLDTRTGEMALCQRAGGDWSCRPMGGTGAAANSDVERLRRENEELRAEIRRLDDMLGLDGRKPGDAPSGGVTGLDPARPPATGFSLPSETQVDQALDYFTNILKKLQDRLKDLESNARKPGPDGEAPSGSDGTPGKTAPDVPAPRTL